MWCVDCAGACPKSYGTNVARLAGLPASVVARAGVMSASREAIYAAGTAEQQHRQHTLQGTAAAGAGADAMDVDSGEGAAGDTAGGVELQQLMSSIKGCLKQLQGGAAGGQGQVVQDKLVQLQQQAALLCK